MFSLDQTAIQLKEQLERYKDAIGDNLINRAESSVTLQKHNQFHSNVLGHRRSPRENSGRNMPILSTQQTPIGDRSGIGFGSNGFMGDQSIVQLQDAIDVIIGKLDQKIDASRYFSVKSGVDVLQTNNSKPPLNQMKNDR